MAQQRGRKSASSLSVVRTIQAIDRVRPPPGLTDAQCDLWRHIVAALPADWFDASSVPLLAEYVRAVDMCELLEGQVQEAVKEGDAEKLQVVLRLRDTESRRVMSLATKMRISQQSTYNAKNGATGKNNGGPSRKPWEFGVGD